MKVIPWKTFTTSAMIATVIATSVLPGFAAAQTETPTVQQQAEQVNLPDKYLGPEGMKKALEDTNSHVIAMDAYALTLLKTPDIAFTGVTNQALVDKVKKDQQTARANAQKWLDDIKSNSDISIIKVNENIISYGGKFDSYFQALEQAIDKKDSATLSSGIQNLLKDVDTYKGETDALKQKLIAFRDALATDAQNFDKDANDIIALIAGTDGSLSVMQKELEAYHQTLNTAIGMIAGGSVAVAWGAGFGILTIVFAVSGVGLIPSLVTGGAGIGSVVAGSVLLAKGTEMMNTAKGQISKVTQDMTTAKQQLVVLESGKNQVKQLHQVISQAVDSVQALSDQWSTMSAKYKALQQSINSIPLNAETAPFIKSDLNTAKKSWNNIATYADELYKHVKVEVK
ncbi:HBL/NHE enterotoxin family protein [Bacillus thuringiensis]|uniref:HBL/NHE enterotoxin family protein n=1 Tax=Bacillus thuringiensis TaxID=1428 RepID=UPI003BF734F9